MNQVKQFEAEPHQKLEIPEELSEKMRYKVLYGVKEHFTVAWCCDYQTIAHNLRLLDVLIDTSDRHQGIVLKKRVTYREFVDLYHVPAIIFPIDEQERAEEGGTHANL